MLHSKIIFSLHQDGFIFHFLHAGVRMDFRLGLMLWILDARGDSHRGQVREFLWDPCLQVELP